MREATGPSSSSIDSNSRNAIVTAFTFAPNCDTRPVITPESTPPDRKTLTGTSETRCARTESVTAERTRSCNSSPEHLICSSFQALLMSYQDTGVLASPRRTLIHVPAGRQRTPLYKVHGSG